jgi:hypothetical protein
MHCHTSTVTHMLRPFNSARGDERSVVLAFCPPASARSCLRAVLEFFCADTIVFFIRSNTRRCRRGKKVSFLSPIRTVYSTVNCRDDNPAGRRTSPTPPIGERKIVRTLVTVRTVRTYCTYFVATVRTLLYCTYCTVQ